MAIMDRTIDQRANIKFCARIGKTPIETSKMLQSENGILHPSPVKKDTAFEIKKWKQCSFVSLMCMKSLTLNFCRRVGLWIKSEVLGQLCDAARQKSPDLWIKKFLDPASRQRASHSALLMQEFMARRQIPNVKHLPYSPDLAPADFWLFPKLKNCWKGKHFLSTERFKQPLPKLYESSELKIFRTFSSNAKSSWSKCAELGGDNCESF